MLWFASGDGTAELEPVVSGRTEVQVSPAGFGIQRGSRIIAAGSCFSDSIGRELARHKFNVLSNPLGTVYNPISLHQQYSATVLNPESLESSLARRDDVHFSYDFHSSFAALSLKETLEAIRRRVAKVHEYLRNCDYLFLTYGTAWLYEKKPDGRPVANCHKMPGPTFTKRLLSVDEVVNSYKNLYAELKSVSPALRIILTLSPVRHQRDGLENNSISKSVLRLACHEIALRFADTDYFPAFEIMMDDLRDYRYYAGDLLHPSKEAKEYIWQKFQGRYFTPDTRDLVSQIREVLLMIEHRPQLEGTKEHIAFVSTALQKARSLSGQADLSTEINLLESKLSRV